MILNIVIIGIGLFILYFIHTVLYSWTIYRIEKVVNGQLKQWNDAWSILRKRRNKKNIRKV